MGHIRLEVLYCNRCGGRCLPPDYLHQKLRNGSVVHLCGDCEDWWIKEVEKMEHEMTKYAMPSFSVVELDGAKDLCQFIADDLDVAEDECSCCGEEFGSFATVHIEDNGRKLCPDCRIKPRCKNDNCNSIVAEEGVYCDQCSNVV